MANILVVDDDEELLEIVRDWLMAEQHSVEVALGGVKAWNRLQNEKFDLVIMDWQMPDVDGIDVLKRYRQSGGTIPVIMLTGRQSVDDKEIGLDSGADDYLTKPFHMKELSARIRAALRKGQTAASLTPLGVGNQAVLAKGDLIGTTLANRYEFIDVIGEGGVGIVFKAKHPRLDKLVAVKMLQSTALKESTMVRFEREAKAISRLDHPNIALVYDFGVTERNRPFMVMEFIDGRSLDEILLKDGAMPLLPAIDLFIQICDGMAHAHESGIIHRDVKPSNIMLKKVGNRPYLPKILDFGCAKLREPEMSTPDSKQLTQAGHSFGSPPYMSPEQVRGRVLDERSDIYSLGCLMYELVTARLPFDDESVVEIMFKHLEQEAISLAAARPDLIFPAGFQNIIDKALTKDADKRYQSMSELKVDLEKVRAVMQIANPPGHLTL